MKAFIEARSAVDHRPGDTPQRTFFRGGRFSVMNGGHYFSTREGTLEGPFSSLADAEGELALYIRKKAERDIYGSFG